ncbi:MAG: response regulator transcription factor [Chloroflexi bacterium]|nr:response regulator transcription factor [Chloroflexota bacterium]
MIRVLLADDHTLLRQGLRRILGDDPGISVIGEAVDGLDAVAQTRALAPDVLLMDVHMPRLTGIQAAQQLREIAPSTRIIILTVSDKDADLFGALKAGARGYLLKSAEADQVLDAIHRVAAGDAILPPALTLRVLNEFAAPSRSVDALTKRELDILRLVAQGMGNKEIAVRLTLTENTVKTHVRHILEKLQLRSRTEAASYALREGLE